MKSNLFRASMLALLAPIAASCAVDTAGSGVDLSTGDRDGGTNGGVCVPEHVVRVRLTEGSEITVARMTLQTSAAGIRIWIVAEPGWLLGQTWVTIAHDGSWVQFSENPTPWIDGYVQSVHFDIPLEDAGLECGDIFKLIVQLRVKNTETHTVHRASAEGSIRLDPAKDGWKEFYEVCCEEEEPPGDEGCTLTQGYWRNHAWPGGATSLEIAGETYGRSELLDYISGGVRGNACIILGQQLIAALLNVENGASPIPAIAEAEAAWDMLCTPLGTVVPPSTTAGQILVGYAETLTDYNEGDIGPGHCDERD